MQEENKTQDNSEENLFEKMETSSDPLIHLKRFQRSKNNVVIAGVCSGIAEYLNTDPANIRVVALLTLLLGGWSVVAYFLMAFFLPVDQNPKQLSNEEKVALKKENFRTVIGGLLILTGFHFALLMFGIGSRTRIFIFSNYFVFPIAAIIFGFFILVKYRSDNNSSAKGFIIKYYRSRADKIFLGVCGGLAKYVGVDSSFLRIIFILATLLTLGIFAVIYLLIGISAEFEMEQRVE